MANRKNRRRKPRCPVCRAQEGVRHARDCPLTNPPVPLELSVCPDCGGALEGHAWDHEDSCAYTRGTEVPSENDKRWFEQHPADTVRERPPFPSEQAQNSDLEPGVLAAWVTHVTVRKQSDECRVRRMHTSTLVVIG